MAQTKLRKDKFVYTEGELIVTLSDNMTNGEPSPLKKACMGLGITQREYLLLKKKLTQQEMRILDVIVTDSEGQYRLYITEMCKILDKRKALPSEYLRIL